MEDKKSNFFATDPNEAFKSFGAIGALFVLALIITVPVVLSYIIGPMIGLGFWQTLGLLLLLRFWFT